MMKKRTTPLNFVVMTQVSYYFKASDWETAKRMALLPDAIQGVQKQLESSLCCEETGQEETLT